VECVELPSRVLPTRELAGEFCGDRVADADEAQESAGVRGHGLEDLVDEIVRHRTVVARELIEELIGIRGGAQRRHRQPQARRPAVGCLVQHPDLVGGEGQAAQGEQLDSFGTRETQVLGAQLGEPALQPEPDQGQRRVDPGQEHEPDARRQMPVDVLQGAQGFPADDLLNIVENQPNRNGQPVESVSQVGQELVRNPCPGRRQLVHRAVGGHRGAARQGSGDRGTQPFHVVVAAVQIHPRCRGSARPMHPVREQQGLAVPGRRADQHHTRRPVVQHVEQAWPRDELRR